MKYNLSRSQNKKLKKPRHQSHERSRRFKNEHPTARIFSPGAPTHFFFVKAPNEIIGIGKVVGGNTVQS